jgi:hypothetical protein
MQSCSYKLCLRFIDPSAYSFDVYGKLSTLAIRLHFYADFIHSSTTPAVKVELGIQDDVHGCCEVMYDLNFTSRIE